MGGSFSFVFCLFISAFFFSCDYDYQFIHQKNQMIISIELLCLNSALPVFPSKSCSSTVISSHPPTSFRSHRRLHRIAATLHASGNTCTLYPSVPKIPSLPCTGLKISPYTSATHCHRVCRRCACSSSAATHLLCMRAIPGASKAQPCPSWRRTHEP